MHLRIAFAVALAASAAAATADAASLTPAVARTASAAILVADKQERAGKDCTPYNGPFGFYGNVWCQPPNEMSYMRNLGSRWPMETPPSLKKRKPAEQNSDW
jgi:hypothetical protein